MKFINNGRWRGGKGSKSKVMIIPGHVGTEVSTERKEESRPRSERKAEGRGKEEEEEEGGFDPCSGKVHRIIRFVSALARS